MTRINRRALFVAALLAVASAATGCQDQSGAARQTARENFERPGPEESFELIVETFRRGIEDVPIGFVLRDADGHSMMTGKNEVSHKLIPPANEGEPYKAIITVGSQSRYSIQRSTSDKDEDEETSNNEREDGLAEEQEETDLKVFDQDLITPSGTAGKGRRNARPTSENTEKTVTRQADRQERNYELVYQDGKWTLVTKLDPETEQSIQNAFKRALEMQI
jgi:hypothetical protein